MGGDRRGRRLEPTWAGTEKRTAVELRLDTRNEGAWTVLEVEGEVDLSTAPALRSRVDQLIRDGATRLVIGLEGVGFLDSSGLSALVSSMKEMEEAGGELALVCTQDPVLKVFTVTGLDRVFAIHRSVEELAAT